MAQHITYLFFYISEGQKFKTSFTGLDFVSFQWPLVTPPIFKASYISSVPLFDLLPFCYRPGWSCQAHLDNPGRSSQNLKVFSLISAKYIFLYNVTYPRTARTGTQTFGGPHSACGMSYAVCAGALRGSQFALYARESGKSSHNKWTFKCRLLSPLAFMNSSREKALIS